MVETVKLSMVVGDLVAAPAENDTSNGNLAYLGGSDGGEVSGNGGGVTVVSGNAPEAGDGGPVYVTAGAGGGTSGDGGSVNVWAGAANTAGRGGTVYVIGGQASGSQPGGDVSLLGGFNSSTGKGGDISIMAGNSLEGTPGNILMTAIPTADPHVVGALWNSAGTLKISLG